MKITCEKTMKLWEKLTNLGNLAFQGLLVLMRLYMANIFFKSGLTKLDDWDKTIALFAEEYKVPVIPPEIAAFMGTSVELIAPILLVLGLGSRFAAAALLVMTAVIEFTYAHYDEHYYWAFLLATILFYGAGKFSADNVFRKKCCK